MITISSDSTATDQEAFADPFEDSTPIKGQPLLEEGEILDVDDEQEVTITAASESRTVDGEENIDQILKEVYQSTPQTSSQTVSLSSLNSSNVRTQHHGVQRRAEETDRTLRDPISNKDRIPFQTRTTSRDRRRSRGNGDIFLPYKNDEI